MRLGSLVQRRLPVLASIDPGLVGVATLVAAMGVATVGVRWTIAVATVIGGAWWRSARSRSHRHARRVDAHLATIAELLAASLRAGLSPRQALLAVGERHPRAEMVGLTEACRLIDRNVALRECLTRWGRHSGGVGVLAELVIDAEQTGAPMAEDLFEFARERRRTLRRDAEERARRLPVMLLLPLVFCVLPAFVIVAVVPMVVTGASQIGFPS